MSEKRKSIMSDRDSALAERKRLKNIRAFYRDMAAWEKNANETLTLKQKAEQREAKEKELMKKYGFDK